MVGWGGMCGTDEQVKGVVRNASNEADENKRN